LKKYEFFKFFQTLFYFISSVDLGSGVRLDVPLHTHSAKLSGKQPNRMQKNPHINSDRLPAASPVSVTEIDGVEIRVERIPIRYERVEDIFDELPEFAQEIIAQQTLRGI
jgi:hypothetical protein